MSPEISIAWDRLKKSAAEYPPAAYSFVQDGLRYTVERLREHDASEAERHVSGQELCIGLRDYALKQYGLLARTVLTSWNVHRTEDFGRMVFAMVDAKLLRKTEDDREQDFQGVFEFDEAFAAEVGLC